jgi:hypothetical protein
MNTPTHAILMPLAALAWWTLLMLALIPIARFRAAFAGRVTADDFKLGESSRVPAEVSIPNRVYMNLLEVPVLFYVACIVALVTHQVDDTLVTLAWIYVGLRVLHALIYLSYNQVLHRLAAFAISNFVLIAMWALLSWRLTHPA